MERVDVEQRAEKARRFFLEGYNCAQAVVLAYCDLFDISPSLAASISAPLGGGMGRLREVCGAVSGMFMVAGLFYKNDIPSDMTKRKNRLQHGAGFGREIEGPKRFYYLQRAVGTRP